MIIIIIIIMLGGVGGVEGGVQLNVPNRYLIIISAEFITNACYSL